MLDSMNEVSNDTNCQPADLADEEIVSRVLAGDRASFELIMRRYNQRLFRVVRGILRNDDETEDVLQDTYVRAFEHLSQFSGRAKFSTWLTRIAVHESLARLKRGRRLQTMDFDAPENMHMVPHHNAPSAEHQTSNKELGALLSKAVDELPLDLRMVFALRMIEGLDTTESADCLELSESNVKIRLYRARAQLRKRIDAQIGTEVRSLYEFGGSRCDRIVQAVFKRLSLI
jgi:RNA polymerase sigma-70 factor, ECF subfamily